MSTTTTCEDPAVATPKTSPGRSTRQRFAILAALLTALGAAAGLTASSPSHGSGQARQAHTAPAGQGGGAGVNPGGAMHQANASQRKRALSSFGVYNPVGVWGGRTYNLHHASEWSALSRLLSRLPAADLPEVSNNWSGYQVLSARTHVAATSAAGTWVVPKVKAPSASMDGYSAIWVGIGGSCLDPSCTRTDQSLIQLGTSEDASPTGQSLYEAWYEVLPAAEVVIPSLEIAPGDKVSASLHTVGSPVKGYNPANGGWGGRAYNPVAGGVWGGGTYNATSSPETWVLSISVKSPSGASERWSKTLAYASSLASAEWIVEGPSTSCNGSIAEEPLADYRSVGFEGLQENAKAPSFGLSNLVVGYDPFGELSLPVPSFLARGKTATYYLPLVAKGGAEARGKASCNGIMGVQGPTPKGLRPPHPENRVLVFGG